MSIVSENGTRIQSFDDAKPPTLAELAQAKCFPIATLTALGWAGSRDGVVVPYRTREGTPFRTRIRCRLTGGDKYRWGPGTGSSAYGLDHLDRYAKAAPESLLIVEGETDCVALWYEQFAAIGLPGNTMQNCLDLWMAEPFESVVLWQEPDSSGVTFRDRTVDRLRQIGYAGKVRVIDAAAAGAKDPCELRGLDPKSFRRTMEGLIRNARTLPNAIEVQRVADAGQTPSNSVKVLSSDPLPESQTVQKCAKLSLSERGVVGANGGPRPKPVNTVDKVKLSEIVGKPMQWLIPGWLPLGQMTLVSGDGRAGKSTVLMRMIADLTTGRATLGLSYEPTGPVSVVLVSIEDDSASKIAPIIAAADGDLERVTLIRGIRDPKGEPVPLTLERIDEFRRTLVETGARVLILDPVSSLLPGSTDDNSDSGVRGCIDPLLEMAKELEVSVIAVKHVGKNTTNGSNPHLGSVAWRNRSRASWVLVKGQDEERFLFDNGASASADQPGRKFTLAIFEGQELERVRRVPFFAKISETDFREMSEPVRDGNTGRVLSGGVVRLEWLGESELTLADLSGMRTGEDPVPKSGSAKACAEWVRDHLSEGYAYLDPEVAKAAEGAGFSERQYREAKKNLKASSGLNSKQSGAVGSVWLVGFASTADLRNLPKGSLTVSQSHSLTDPPEDMRDCEMPSAIDPASSFTDGLPASVRLRDCETVRLRDALEEIPVELLSNSGRLVL